MTLGQKQRKFTRMIASVMEWSESELDEMYIEANKI